MKFKDMRSLDDDWTPNEKFQGLCAVCNKAVYSNDPYFTQYPGNPDNLIYPMHEECALKRGLFWHGSYRRITPLGTKKP